MPVNVKEQRVDGSWYKIIYFVFKVYSNGSRERLSSQNPVLANNKHIISTLNRGSAPLCLKRKIRLVNNNLFLNKSLNFTTTSKMSTISGGWIAGFVDAEGCFNSSIFKRKAMTLGYQVKLRFMIDQKDSLNDMLYLKDVLNLFLTHRKSKEKIANMHRIESNSFVKISLIIKKTNLYYLIFIIYYYFIIIKIKKY